MSDRSAIPGTLPALGGALLLRRRPMRHLMQHPLLARRLPLLIALLLLSIFTVHWFSTDAEYLTDRILAVAGITLVHAAFWLILLFTVAEPVFNILLRSATFDEAELHWWARWRMTSRVGMLVAFVSTYVIYALGNTLLLAVPGGDILAQAIAIIWGFLILRLIARDWWNNVSSQAFIIACGPTFVFFTGLFLLSYPWPLPLAFAIVCLALVPFTMNDLFMRFKAQQEARVLADDPDQDEKRWLSTLELLHCSGDQKTARWLLDALHEDEAKRDALPSWALVRLLSTSDQFMEAVDAGLAALDRDPESIQLQMAMAEACLGVRDPENAAAHAEEALDLAGGSASTEEGSEALLLLGLASYNQWEMVSGLQASARVVDCAHHEPGPRLKRIVREARMLVRRFGTGIEEQ